MKTIESPGVQPYACGISVVIPVYNSADGLGALVGRLSAVLEGSGQSFEVVLVNDGSRDGSWESINALTSIRPWLVGIDLMRNYGQHNAVLCGIRAARFDTIATLDDDLQNPPEEIPKLLRKLAEGFDVVYGTPEREQHGLWRDFASQITKLVLQKAMGAEIARNISPFRVFRTEVREAFATYRSPNVSIDVLLTWGTSRFAAVRVAHEPRAFGRSNYTLAALFTHAMNMVTGFSSWPLRVASVCGFGFTLFGIFVLIYVVGRYFISGAVVPGFPFLASIIAIFAGAQLFALGIMGEYMARLNFSMVDRPSYAVRRNSSRGSASDVPRA